MAIYRLSVARMIVVVGTVLPVMMTVVIVMPVVAAMMFFLMPVFVMVILIIPDTAMAVARVVVAFIAGLDAGDKKHCC